MWDPRLSVNSLSTRELSFAQDLDLYDRLEIRRLAVWLPKLQAHGLEASVQEIQGRQLQVDAVLAGAVFDLTAPDSWPEVAEVFQEGAELAERLGAAFVQTTGGRAGGLPYEEAADRFARAVSPVRAALARRGLGLALEPTRPQFAHVGFVHTLRDGWRLAEELDLWLVPDTAHDWWEPGISALLRTGASRWASFQVADLVLGQPVVERVVPGDGQVPIGAMMAAARAGGFEGPFELELIGSAVEAEGYESALRRSLEHLESLLSGPFGGSGAESPVSLGHRGPGKIEDS